MKKILYTLLFSFYINGYANIDEGKKHFESLIIGYNHGVIKAAQKNKFKHLKQYLTKEIYYKTLVWIESYQDSNLFMDAILLDTSFKAFKQDKFTAILETEENWKYRYIFTKTKEVVKAPQKVNYQLRYYFVKLRNGDWKINHIKILAEKNSPIKESP